MIKSLIKRVLQRILTPNLFLRFQTWRKGYWEPEIRLLPLLCDSAKVSIDIGADDGLYLAHMYKYSKKCVAFEPRIESCRNLEKLFSDKLNRIKIETVALSNTPGKAQLRMFKQDGGRSTIESNNLIEKFGEVEIVTVPVKTLDDFVFNESVGFIKIDVEGHEAAVLQGGLNLIRKDKPSFIIEIEERHNTGSIANVINFMHSLEYQVFFYKDFKLNDINLFDAKVDQNILNLNDKKKYINNFIFLSKESVRKLIPIIADYSS